METTNTVTKYETDLVPIERHVKRFDVCICDFEYNSMDTLPKTTAEIGKRRRPALVISPDDYNEKSKRIIVLPFCSNNLEKVSDEIKTDNDFIRYGKSKGDILIPVRLGLRDQPSFLIVNQPRAIWRDNVGNLVGRLSSEKTPKLVKEIMDYLKYMFIDPQYLNAQYSVDIETEIEERVKQETSKLQDQYSSEFKEKYDYFLKDKDNLQKIVLSLQEENETYKKKYLDLKFNVNKIYGTASSNVPSEFDIRKMSVNSISKYLSDKSTNDIVGEVLKKATTDIKQRKPRKTVGEKEYKEAYDMFLDGKITQSEAAELLDVSPSSIYRRFKLFENETNKTPL